MSSDDFGVELDPRPVGPTCPFFYRHRHVVRVDPSRMVLKPTRLGHSVLVLIVLAGLVVLGLGCALLGARTIKAELGWMFGLSGLGITGFGLLALWDCTIRVVFDRRRGRYHSNRPLITPTHFSRLDGQLDNIAALQICRGHSSFGRKRGYQWHQLNLVFHDPPGKRVPLMTQVGAKAVRADAEALAEFLDRPVLEHSAELPRHRDASKKLRRALGPADRKR